MHPDLQHGAGVRGDGVHRPSTKATPIPMTLITDPDGIYITAFRFALRSPDPNSGRTGSWPS